MNAVPANEEEIDVTFAPQKPKQKRSKEQKNVCRKQDLKALSQMDKRTETSKAASRQTWMGGG